MFNNHPRKSPTLKVRIGFYQTLVLRPRGHSVMSLDNIDQVLASSGQKPGCY